MVRTGDISLAFNCVFSGKSDRHRLPGTRVTFDSDELAEIALKSLIPVHKRSPGIPKEGIVAEESSACAHHERNRLAVGLSVAWPVAPVGPKSVYTIGGRLEGVSPLILIIASRREGHTFRPFLLAEAEGNRLGVRRHSIIKID
jgi:hypothetical protein